MHKINDDLPHISVRGRHGVLSDALLLTKAAELAQELGIRLSTSSSNPNCSHHQSVPVPFTASSSQPVAAPPTVNHQPVTATPQVSHQPVAATLTVSSRQLSPTASSDDDLTVDGQLILSNVGFLYGKDGIAYLACGYMERLVMLTSKVWLEPRGSCLVSLRSINLRTSSISMRLGYFTDTQ